MPMLTLPRRAFLQTAAVLAAAGSGGLRGQSGGPTRWALLSDTHIPEKASDGHRGFSPQDNLKKVLPGVLAYKPEAAVICGDLARLKGTPGDYAMLRQMLAPLTETVPVAMALGNHDDRANFEAGFANPSGAQAVPKRHVVLQERGGVRVIVLDSLIQPDFTPGLLGRAQRGWLAKFLEDSPKTPTLLFVHHTLDDGDGSLLDAPRLFELIRPHRQVKAVVFGHSHRYSYSTESGLHLINLPAVGYNFSDDQPVGWVEAALSPEGGEFTLRAVAGNAGQDGRKTTLRWSA